jgi:DNA-directed RNA polymerase
MLHSCQDVYSTVAKTVEARVKEDAASGRSEALKILKPSQLGGEGGEGIDRKLVKQTVMTTVYGVTHMGARLQIANRLSERGWKNEAEIFQVSTEMHK